MTSSIVEEKGPVCSLDAPPDCVPDERPVVTKDQSLPFGKLTWENFERLCYRLAGREEKVEHYARYGRQGQAQQGIDIFVRRADGKYDVWQAKRYASFSATDVKDAVDRFLEGAWYCKTERLFLAVQVSLADTKIQDEIESQAARLRKNGITLIPRGGEELSEVIRGYPILVDDFFGRQWSRAFLGDEAAGNLDDHLDGREFARVRQQLCSFYRSHFHLLDVGAVLPFEGAGQRDTSPSLLERFATPDIIVREKVSDSPPSLNPEAEPASLELTAGIELMRQHPRESMPYRRSNIRRTSTHDWLGEGSHLAVVGDVGMGKSTLLRCIALDLLGEQIYFPELASRWGARLPLHIPFAAWTRAAVNAGRQVSLSEVVDVVLQPFLTASLLGLLNKAIDEQRILLLIDGLDEWADEQAARTTLQVLLSFSAAHNIPTIVTARPSGLRKIGTLPANWHIGTLAPLSHDQQEILVSSWFTRFADSEDAELEDGGSLTQVRAQTDKFFGEIRQDNILFPLAEIPLLLVGLVALFLRQVVLPRSKTQVVQKLVEILLEIHPQSRATAAGDTQGRFVHSGNPEVRQAALARLAYCIRKEGADAGIPKPRAMHIIQGYLGDPEVFGYPAERAMRAASEMLAVNAETNGLLIERAPGEISFAHAVFEEFLSAIHIQSWPFSDLTSWMAREAASPRWRNVISNVISLSTRRSEVDEIVEIIESKPSVDLNIDNAINREILLSEVAFNNSRKSPDTVHRLVNRAFKIIECSDWNFARSEALGAALTAINDPALGSQIEARLRTWAPRREEYSQYVLQKFAAWKPASDLLESLKRGLFDEQRSTQRGAAEILGKIYGNDQNICTTLLEILESTLDPSVAAAVLEALTLGWRSNSKLASFLDKARMSTYPGLQLAGVFGRVDIGRADNTDRDILVNLLSEGSSLNYWDRPFSRELLVRGWPNDSAVVGDCLEVLSAHGHMPNRIEQESATYYLLHCSPNHSDIQDWILKELGQEHPFLSSHDAWKYLTPFAMKNPEIRAQVFRYFFSGKGRYFLHWVQDLVVGLKDVQFRDGLIGLARESKGLDLYWQIKILLMGWGRSDLRVCAFLDEIANWEDNRLLYLLSFLPEIVTDRAAGRAELLRIGQSDLNPRNDFLARGFVNFGCDAADDEVVKLLLSRLEKGAPAYRGGEILIEEFPSHPAVRQYALARLDENNPLLSSLAQVYEADSEIRSRILECVNSLPVRLRDLIVDVAAAEADRNPAFVTLLRSYDLEVDTEIRIKSSVGYHKYLCRTIDNKGARHIDALSEVSLAVGPDHVERRAAAFAGLLVLGRLDRFCSLREHAEKPLQIQTGGDYGRESQALMALIAQHWQELRSAFGGVIAERFGSFGADDGHLWDCVAPYVGASEAVRRDFLAYCEKTTSALGLQSLRRLSQERPSSNLLFDHCWRGLEANDRGGHVRHSPWAVRRIRLEIGYILRDYFGDREDVRVRLQELFRRSDSSALLVAWVTYSPDDPCLADLNYTPLQIGEERNDWVTAVHLGSSQCDAVTFIEIVRGMLNRNDHNIWDFQGIVNISINERLRRDSAATQRLKEILDQECTMNELASLPRLLASAGQMDKDLYEGCRKLLVAEHKNHPFVRAGYDAIDDSIRAIAQSLLDAIATPINF